MSGVLEQMQIPHAAEPEYLLDTVTVNLENMPIGTILTIGNIPNFKAIKSNYKPMQVILSCATVIKNVLMRKQSNNLLFITFLKRTSISGFQVRIRSSFHTRKERKSLYIRMHSESIWF